MRISVVVASYNHAPYLRACIESVLEQTARPYEVIVVDDGSTDASREIIASFGGAVRAVYQRNQGTYAALNTGIGLAAGDWIAIQNSDDLWERGKLELQGKLAAAHPEVGLIHTGFVCIDEEGREFPKPATVTDYVGPPVAEMLPLMIHQMPIIISSAILPRTVWDAAGPFESRYRGAGDLDLCIRISETHPFGYVADPLVQLRKHRDNSGTNPARMPARWVHDDWQILCERTLPTAAGVLFDKAQAGRIDRKQAARALASLGVIHTRSGEPKLARRVLLLAARLDPSRVKTWLRYLDALRTPAQRR